MEVGFVASLTQNTAALGAYKQDSQDGEDLRFESISGRHWSATYVLDDNDYYDTELVELTFKINH